MALALCLSLHKMWLILTTEAIHGMCYLHLCITARNMLISTSFFFFFFSSPRSSPSACMLECPYTSFTRLWCFSGPATVNCHKQSVMMEPLFLHRHAALAGGCDRDCLFWNRPETCGSICSVGRRKAGSWKPRRTVIQYLLVGRVHRDTPCWCFVFTTTAAWCPPHFWLSLAQKIYSPPPHTHTHTHTEGTKTTNR